MCIICESTTNLIVICHKVTGNNKGRWIKKEDAKKKKEGIIHI